MSDVAIAKAIDVGQYYRLAEADCLPKPVGHLPLVIGGMGELRTLKLVAEQADEWSSVNLTPDLFAEKTAVLAKHCAVAGRDPATIRKSMMLFGFVGPDDRTVEGLLRRFYNDDGATTAALHARATERRMFAGTTQQLVDYLGALAGAACKKCSCNTWSSMTTVCRSTLRRKSRRGCGGSLGRLGGRANGLAVGLTFVRGRLASIG